MGSASEGVWPSQRSSERAGIGLSEQLSRLFGALSAGPLPVHLVDLVDQLEAAYEDLNPVQQLRVALDAEG